MYTCKYLLTDQLLLDLKLSEQLERTTFFLVEEL